VGQLQWFLERFAPGFLVLKLYRSLASGRLIFVQYSSAGQLKGFVVALNLEVLDNTLV